jgi:uncharacterized glyoxalase superfamily protein PhnB/Tfp pilus assembly protein PilF
MSAQREAIVPILRYRDVGAAVDWLRRVLGLAVDARVADDAGAVVYAQMRLGDSVLMVGPVGDTRIGPVMVQPDEVGGRETQICYLRVADPAAVCARARYAGAEIVLDYGAAGASAPCWACRDPEGHIWNFGSYDPWQRPAAAERGRRRLGALQAALGVALAANLLAFAGLWSGLPQDPRSLWPKAVLAPEAARPFAPSTAVHAAVASPAPLSQAVAIAVLSEPEAGAGLRIDAGTGPAGWPPSKAETIPAAPATEIVDTTALAVAGLYVSAAPADGLVQHAAGSSPPPIDAAAQTCASGREPDQRIGACSAILDRGGGLAWAYNSRGAAYYLKGQSYRAVDSFTAAIARDPRLTVAYVNRGRAYADRHDFVRAVADFTAAIRIDPTNMTARAHRALALIASDRPQAALPDAMHLLTSAIDSPGLLETRGRILAALGNRRGAQEDFTRAAAMRSIASRLMAALPARTAEAP